jgi:DNA-binding GntR family transcriptional regulator
VDRPRPLHRQIADELEASITDGTYTVGDLLPSINQAVTRWQVSTTTIRAAYQTLTARGLVEPVHGLGHTVTTGTRDTALDDLALRVARLERTVYGHTPDKPPVDVESAT